MDERALGGDAGRGLGIAHAGEPPGGDRPRAGLQGERALPRRGHELLDHAPGLSAAAQALQARGGQDERLDLAGGELAQPRVDVAAQLADLEVVTDGAHLGGAAQAARAHPAPRGQLGERAHAADDVAGLGALGDGRQLQALGQLGGDVLGRVHGHVDAAVQQRPLEL